MSAYEINFRPQRGYCEAFLENGRTVISVLDYGAGNLRSVQNALDEIGLSYQIVRDPVALQRGSKIILPGVGHFGQMMRSLDALDVRAALKESLRDGTPFLGICLGLHALLENSEEAPDERGLGVFAGTVTRFSAAGRVPHMGWNQVQSSAGSRLVPAVAPHPWFYFAHSYYVPELPQTAATCDYSGTWTAVLQHKNIFGVQFHPEKSGSEGLRVVKAFGEL